MSDSTTEKIDFVLSANADKVAQECDRAGAKIDQLVGRAASAAQKVQSSNSALADSYFHVVDHVKAAASAVDNLGARTDALTGKQHTAWTAIATTVGGATGGMIEKVLKFVESTQKAQDAAEAGFGGITRQMWTTTDALRVVNDRTEQAIAKLEHKSTNYLALDLDEARVNADALAKSLEDDNSKRDALMSKSHQGWWHTLLHQGTTNNIEGTVSSMGQQLEDQGNQLQVDTHKGDKGAAAKDQQGINSGLNYLAGKMSATIDEIDRDAAAHKGPDRRVERSEAVGVLATTNARQDDIAEQGRKTGDDSRLRQLQDQKEADEQAKAAAAAAAAAARAASEKRMQAYEYSFAKMESGHQLQIGEAKLFWERMMAQEQVGSDNYIRIYQRVGLLAQEDGHKRAEQIQRDAEQSQAALRAGQTAMREMGQSTDRTNYERQDSSREMDAARERAAATIAEIRINEQAGTSITKLDAARQMAMEHARGYQEEMDRLQAQRNAIQNSTWLTDPEKQQALDTNDRSQLSVQVARQSEVERDRAATSPQDSSALVGLRDGLNELTDASRDAAHQMQDLSTGALSRLNSALVDELTTRHHHGWHDSPFRAAGADIFKQTTAAGVNKAEGMVMEGLGFGKAGSRSNPMYIKDVDFAAPGKSAGAGAFVPPAARPFLQDADQFWNMAPPNIGVSGGGDGSSQTSMPIPASGFGKIMGSLLGNVSSFAGFFADGGDFPGDSSAIVGERGPELVHFGRSGHVTPNNEIGDMMGGGNGFAHYGDVHVDAAWKQWSGRCRGCGSPWLHPRRAGFYGRHAACPGGTVAAYARHGEALTHVGADYSFPWQCVPAVRHAGPAALQPWPAGAGVRHL